MQQQAAQSQDRARLIFEPSQEHAVRHLRPRTIPSGTQTTSWLGTENLALSTCPEELRRSFQTSSLDLIGRDAGVRPRGGRGDTHTGRCRWRQNEHPHLTGRLAAWLDGVLFPFFSELGRVLPGNLEVGGLCRLMVASSTPRLPTHLHGRDGPPGMGGLNIAIYTACVIVERFSCPHPLVRAIMRIPTR